MADGAGRSLRNSTAMTRKAPATAEGGRQASPSWVNQMGTLGGGNHFIEVCLDEAGPVWVMLHSGSPRHRQRASARYFIELARRDMERCAHPAAGPGPGLLRGRQPSTSTTTCEAVGWAQEYARAEPRRDDGRWSLAGARAASARPSESHAKR